MYIFNPRKKIFLTVSHAGKIKSQNQQRIIQSLRICLSVCLLVLFLLTLTTGVSLYLRKTIMVKVVARNPREARQRAAMESAAVQLMYCSGILSQSGNINI